jgi:hypothetical protein
MTEEGEVGVIPALTYIVTTGLDPVVHHRAHRAHRGKLQLGVLCDLFCDLWGSRVAAHIAEAWTPAFAGVTVEGAGVTAEGAGVTVGGWPSKTLDIFALLWHIFLLFFCAQPGRLAGRLGI